MGSVWLTDLADACRSTGLRVIEEPGWRTRGHGGLATRPQGILCHHTAASAKSYATNPYPSLRTVRDGRSDLDGPLSQLGLQRDLAVRVIAAGRCWHAGKTAYAWQNNDHAIGIEAEHDGVSEWPEHLYGAYVRLVSGLRKWYAVELDHVAGHKEAAVPKGRKTDPNFPMPAFRTAVAGHSTSPNPPQEELTMADAAELKAQAEANATLAGKRWKQTQDALDAHDRQEDARYTELHQVHEKVDKLQVTVEQLIDALAGRST